MAEERVQRKLTAILAADVVGYSRLMGEDETGTLAALKAHRAELFAPKAAQHHGRTVKLMGDGELLEFPSVVEAVLFAVDVQSAMSERNAAVPAARRIRFRIGINVGDVVIDGDDLYGDGVNIAARLEAIAEPGGICLSRTARDQVRDRLDLDLRDLGDVTVKNIARPVRTFAVEMNDKARALQTPVQVKPSSRARRPWNILAVGGAVTIAIVGVIVWQQSWRGADTASRQVPTVRPKHHGPSIAVLPFANRSEDKGQDYFSDGITEDITTDLSKVAGLFVTPSSATRRFKRKSVDPRTVASEFGVRHILEGSVQRSDNRLRITVKLIDAESGVQIWADRYDRDLKDIFAIQDDIATRVVAALSRMLKGGSLSRIARVYTPVPEAYDLYIQGRAKRIPPTPANLAAALKMFEKTIELDPRFAGGYAGAAYVHLLRYGNPHMAGASPAAILDTALRFAERAVKLDPTFGPAWGSLSEAYMRKGRFDDALNAIEKAIKAAPNDSLMRATYGRLLGHIGRQQDGIEQVKRAMRMSPDSLPMLYFLGANYRAAGQFKAAIETLTEHRKRLGGRVIPPPTTQLIAAYVQAGLLMKAQAETEKLLKVSPRFTLSVAARTHAYKSADDMARFLGALRKAGVPEKIQQ
jgi:adenylate cyclase